MSKHSRGWSQGKYRVKFPQKYIGSKAPVYRSSYEERFCRYCDLNTKVVKWASELIEIPYFFKFDNKNHRYITDFYCEVKSNDGKVVRYIIEIKPQNQNVFSESYKQPKPPKKKTAKAMANYQAKIIEQERNRAKWTAAQAFCKKRGYVFKIMTENDLF